MDNVKPNDIAAASCTPPDTLSVPGAVSNTTNTHPIIVSSNESNTANVTASRRDPVT
jgi:hypothetical protein